MTPPNDPPTGIPIPGDPNHEEEAHRLEALRRAILGRWITSFDLQFPDVQQSPDPTAPPTVTLVPTVFLSCFTFASDGSFTLFQRRNKGGAYEERKRGGKYTVGFNAETHVAGGDIAITSGDGIVLRYFLRREDELHFIMDSAVAPTPIAQGTMYKAELVWP